MPSAYHIVPAPEQANALTPQVSHSLRIDLVCRFPQSELARLYRTIENALPLKEQRIVQFASAYSGEGAGEIAFETAIVAARLIGKRVLFIDTASSTTRTLPETPGLPLDTLMLSGRSPHEGIAQVAGSDLHLAVLRGKQPDGFTPMSLRAVEAALAHLRADFDLILLDSQAILADAFSMALAKLVDGTVLVVEAERTRAPVAQESKRLIEAGGGRVIGAILNRRRLYIPAFFYRLLYRHNAR